MNKRCSLYIIAQCLLLYTFASFAGPGMSCLNKPAVVQQGAVAQAIRENAQITQEDVHNLNEAVKNGNYEAAQAVLQRKPQLAQSYLYTSHVHNTVQTAALCQRFGFNTWRGVAGYSLLENTLESRHHETGLIAWYMAQGADPHYTLQTSYWSPNRYRPNRKKRVSIIREGLSQGTIMNRLCYIAYDAYDDYVFHRDGLTFEIFIAKACALIKAGASLSLARYEDSLGMDARQLSAYRMNMPWQLKRLLFSHFCLPQVCPNRRNYHTDKAKQFLLLRDALMKTWNERVISDQSTFDKQRTTASVLACMGLKDLCFLIAQYGSDTYQDLENKEYFDRNNKDVQCRLVCAPTDMYKPCVHSDGDWYARPSDPCTGPCKEVFEAFGMQQPDPERYKGLKNSRFAIEEISGADQTLPSQIK